MGSNPTLVRVFLCPCVGPIPILGLIPDGIIGYKNFAVVLGLTRTWNQVKDVSHHKDQEKMRGQRWRLPVQPLGYVMSTKVIFRQKEVFLLAEVCLPRRPHAGQPTSLGNRKEKKNSEKAKARLHADVSEDRLQLEQRLPLV